MTIRRTVTAALAVAAASAVLVTTPAFATTPAARRLDPDSVLGVHVPGIQSGSMGSAPAVPVRLWDSGTAWALIQPKKNRFEWGNLDRAVSAARGSGAEILYVLGQTPTWAATNKVATDYLVPGSTSAPKKMAYWKTWVKAVAKRYKGRIDAYQIWNEANLSTFWTGGVSTMANMTAEAYKIIKRIDPKAEVVAASTTLRLTPTFYNFYPSYLSELRRRDWPVDVFAGHFYPASTGTPDTRVGFIERFRRTLADAGAPNRPIWDTEINYGLAGPGPAYPDKDITGTKAASYVAQTYLDSARLGVARAYWFSWIPELELLGITMQPGEPGAIAFETVGGWLSGVNWRGCGERGNLRLCRTGTGPTFATIAYTGSGKQTYKVGSGVTTMCTALGKCSPVSPGDRIKIGMLPIRFSK